ncbi:MAG: hypothetical protein K8F91_20795 [Candidatus Obscuribacterales bacterium]|nr:hypothetical protein [Candidatus Obscuribacterales bacterium]
MPWTFVLLLQMVSPARASSSAEDAQETGGGAASALILKGEVERVTHINSRSNMKERQAKTDSATADPLNGQIGASSNQQIAKNKTIEWDKWHNKVRRSIWKKFCILLSGGDAIMFGNTVYKLGNLPVPRFPQGTGATYAFTVNERRKISDLRIVASSGNSKLDEILIRSVKSIDGKSVLKFPKGSRRNSVTVSQKLVTTRHGKFADRSYGDVERYSLTSTVPTPN